MVMVVVLEVVATVYSYKSISMTIFVAKVERQVYDEAGN